MPRGNSRRVIQRPKEAADPSSSESGRAKGNRGRSTMRTESTLPDARHAKCFAPPLSCSLHRDSLHKMTDTR